MRADLSALAIAAIFLFAGYGVLDGVGLLGGLLGGRLGRRLAAIGLAYMTGLSSVLVIGLLLLSLGVAVTVPVFVVLGVLVGLIGQSVALSRVAGGTRRREWGGWIPTAFRGERDATSRWIHRHPLAIPAGIAALIVIGWGYRWAQVTPLSQWDAWSIWARKGMILYHYGTPRLVFFGNGEAYWFMHTDYPLLLPLLESIWFRFIGSADTTSLHVEFWLMLVASLAAVAFIASRFAPAKIWVPIVGFIGFVPGITSQLMTMYADVPMGLLLMIGVLLLGVWVAERDRAHLALAALFLGACASTKDEGFTYAVCALAVALILAAVTPAERGRRAGDLRAIVFAIAAFAAIVAPWRLWLLSHHIPPDISIGKGLDPGYFFGRTDRLKPTLTAVYQQITNQGQWSYLLPLGIAIALGCLLSRRSARLGAFYAVTGIGVFLLVVWAYVVGTNPIAWWLGTSVNRTVDGVMFVSAAGILHMAGALLRTPNETRGADESRLAAIAEPDSSPLETPIAGLA